MHLHLYYSYTYFLSIIFVQVYSKDNRPCVLILLIRSTFRVGELQYNYSFNYSSLIKCLFNNQVTCPAYLIS